MQATISGPSSVGNVWTTQYTVSGADTDGLVNYSIVFKDLVGNLGSTLSGTGNPRVDKTPPTLMGLVDISSNNISGALAKPGDIVTLAFTTSENIKEPVVIFKSGGGFVTNQSITYTNTANYWTASYTVNSSDPNGIISYTIYVMDYASNSGILNSGTATTVVDTGGPIITITSRTPGAYNGSTSNDNPILLTFTSTEDISGFTNSDITISNGSLNNSLSASGTSKKIYTATFTPGSDEEYTIGIPANRFTDSAGNYNLVSSPFIWNYDSTGPIITITANNNSSSISSGTHTNDSYISLTFTSNEDLSGFTLGDITVLNGSLSNFTSITSKIFTATLTPIIQGVCKINITGSKFTDIFNNFNLAVTEFIWEYDSILPSITITSPDINTNSKTNKESINLTLESNENMYGFTLEDIVVTGGSLNTSTWNKINDSKYAIMFNPIGDGICTIDIAANSFTDEALNYNTAATQFTWTHVLVILFL